VRDRSASSSRRLRRLAVGCILYALVGPFTAQASRGGDLEADLEQLLVSAGPGVVRIEVRRPWGLDERDSPSRSSRRQMPVRRVQGNGLVWDDIGHIVTVADLAQPGDTLRVFGPDGSARAGEFIGQDPDLGISVIQIRTISSLRPLSRGAGFPQSPSWVLTISYPGTTQPVHSSPRLAVARSDKLTAYGGQLRGRLEGVGDPGLAGGGVLDGDGKLLGLLLGEGSESLLLQDRARTGSTVEYPIRSPGPSQAGWIAPIDQLQKTVETLLQDGRNSQGFLGVRVDVPRGSETEKSGPGVPIAGVLPGSPADLAGLLPGDRLVGFDGVPVLSWDELTQRVAAVRPGQVVRVDLIRAGQGAVLKVRVDDRAHAVWCQRQRQMTNGREKLLRHQIEGLRQQLELLRHQLLSAR
jgi:S1-C subfamily serine protease